MALESTELSQWLIGSTWAFLILLTFHSLGLGLLVGVLLVVDLRVMGIAKGLPLRPFTRLMPAVWLGFALNAFSGIALFIAEPTRNFHNTAFWLKMACIVIAVAIGLKLNSTVLRQLPETEISAGARLLAGISIATWTAAAVAGRLIAYT